MLQPAIYAHRGATASISETVRENTIAAFQQAIDLGANGIELDVRCTIDRVLVVYHDAAIEGQAIDQLTWAEIQAIDPEIPTLKQVVAYCANRILLDVEIKESSYETEVLGALQPLTLDTFVITSFRLEVIDRIKQLNPQITIGFLIDAETIEQFPNAKLLNEKLNAIGVNFLATDWLILNHPMMAQLSPPIFWVWTVNSAIVMQDLITEAKTPSTRRQIAALITDDCDRALALRD